MNIDIVSLDPFVVEFRLYNLLGDIDGHPMVRFDMATGKWSLAHDKGYANFVSMSEHPQAGQPIVLAPESKMLPIVKKVIAERVGYTGFHDEWATKAFNKHFVGDVKYPRYFFGMWDKDEKGEISCHFIGEPEYAKLKEWMEKVRSGEVSQVR